MIWLHKNHHTVLVPAVVRGMKKNQVSIPKLRAYCQKLLTKLEPSSDGCKNNSPIKIVGEVKICCDTTVVSIVDSQVALENKGNTDQTLNNQCCKCQSQDQNIN